MRTTRIVLGAFFVMLVLAVTAPARAQSTVDECRARIDLIQADLVVTSSGIGGNNPQQTYSSLASKLQAAEIKLNQRKFADALQKLQDFKTAVIALRDAAKPKLSAADAGLLLDGDDNSPIDSQIDEGVNGAIACVALLP